MKKAIFLSLMLSFSTAYSEEKASLPTPLNIPSNLHPGDVTDAFIAEKNLDGVVPSSLLQMGDSDYVFIVDKSARSLSIWTQMDEDWKRVGHFPTDMGKKNGDKNVLGDHRTPEGIYFMIGRYDEKALDYSRYGSRAFVTNYPNLFDKREGKTGSGIWLHAVPDTVPLTRGSRGCVVVRDDIIKHVTQFVSLKKTPIIIRSKENYLPLEQWKSEREKLSNWLESWRAAWQGGDVDNYMNYYSKSDFRALKMNWKQWRWFKKDLSKKYDYINVKISQPAIYAHNDEYVIRFFQTYQSDKVNDFGEKTLYLKKESGELKIVSEQWQEAAQQTTVGAVNNNN